MKSLHIFMIFIPIIFLPLYYLIISVLHYLKTKAKKSIKFRNDLLAFTYLIISLAPNLCAFSVIEFLIASNKEDKLTLFLVFVIGIIVMIKGRRFRDFVAEKTSETKKSVDLMNIKKQLNS